MMARLVRFTIRSFVRAAVLVSILSAPFFTMPAIYAAEREDAVILMVDGHLFQPDEVHVRPGSRILFRNEDKDLHSLTLLGHEDLMDEVYIDPGKEHVFTMPSDMKPQTLELGCNIHIAMKGKIVVD